MSLRRVLILLGKELVDGPKNYIFLMALIIPVVLTLLVSLIFGTYFSGRSRLGLVDQGSSQLTSLVKDNPALLVRIYSSAEELEDAVSRGAVDMGMLVPAAFDSQVASRDTIRFTVYVWGESHMQNRIILGSALVQGIRQVAGQEVPVEIVQNVLGEGASIPWEERLMPLFVLMAIIIGGTLVPATSLVNEKMKRTLTALAVSPASLLEIFAAKGLLGVIVSVFSAVLLLFLNRSFGTQPVLLLIVLVLGAVFSAAIGVILGAVVKDINTLFATVKSLGIFLYAPGILMMFPNVPQWIGQLMPTYYIIQPVLEISQNNAGLRDVLPEVAILIGLIVLTFMIVIWQAGRTQAAAAAA